MSPRAIAHKRGSKAIAVQGGSSTLDWVIEKVDCPTDWVNSLVIVEKKGGGLRLCLDPRDLNKAVRREHYQLPTIEGIASRQSGNQVFSVLDANSAFWQIKLEDSDNLQHSFRQIQVSASPVWLELIS